MNSPAPDAEALDRLRAELESIDGVRRAVIDGPPLTIYLVAQRSEEVPVELLARAAMARHGIAAERAELHVCFLPSPQPARRVRFLSARLERPAVGRALASVALEWEGKVFEDELEGEGGTVSELRLAALATLRSLEAVLSGALRFHLVGIKTVLAFDAHLVVVLLRVEDGGTGALVGTALAGESPERAATRAVLNATNRILGNYLYTED